MKTRTSSSQLLLLSALTSALTAIGVNVTMAQLAQTTTRIVPLNTSTTTTSEMTSSMASTVAQNISSTMASSDNTSSRESTGVMNSIMSSGTTAEGSASSKSFSSMDGQSSSDTSSLATSSATSEEIKQTIEQSTKQLMEERQQQEEQRKERREQRVESKLPAVTPATLPAGIRPVNQSTLETTSEGESSSETVINQTQTTPVLQEEEVQLGCYNNAGSWTTDRTSCTQNQEQFLWPENQMDNVTEPQFTAQIKESFGTPRVTDARRMELLNLIQDMQNKLTDLQNKTTTPDQTKNVIADTKADLDERYIDYSQRPMEIDEIRSVTEALKQKLAEIDASMGGMDLAPQVKNVLTHMPDAIKLLQDAQVPLSDLVILNYSQWANAVQNKCTGNINICPFLSPFLDALVELRDGMQKGIKAINKPELENQVDALFQQ